MNIMGLSEFASWIVLVLAIPAVAWMLVEMYQSVTGKSFMCLFGLHGEPVYTGEIRIRQIDRTIFPPLMDYSNVKRCPNCAKIMKLDNVH